MDHNLRTLLFVFVVVLIWMCARRQRRYWRELSTNRLSGSVKAGYTVATICMGATLGYALLVNTPEMWGIFLTVVSVGFMFCIKITFSPAVLALTLGVCAVQLQLNDTFPFLEVWNAFINILTWRLPEQVRACYAYFSFVWMLLVLFTPAAAPEAIASASATDLDGLMDVA